MVLINRASAIVRSVLSMDLKRTEVLSRMSLERIFRWWIEELWSLMEPFWAWVVVLCFRVVVVYPI